MHAGKPLRKAGIAWAVGHVVRSVAREAVVV